MRGFLFLTTLLFSFHSAFGQLTITPSENGKKTNYLYVKADLLFVKNDLRLIKNPNPETEPSIYLRKDAQLLQAEEQQTANSGNGGISIFQEGTTNAFDYNYWGSPVSSPENGLFGISLLYAPVSQIASNPAQHTSALNGSSKPLTISSRWIYTFSGHSYSNWNFVGSQTAISPGLGFTMKGIDGKDETLVEGIANNSGNAQRYDFRGRPNSGVIKVPVAAENFVLVGNPYPSALDLSLFLLENSGLGTMNTSCYGNIERQNVTTGIAYFWDSKENGNSHYVDDYMGGYGAFSPVDPCTTGIYEVPVFRKTSGEEDGSKGKHHQLRFVPVARGFMVKGAQGGNIIFRNAHRSFIRKNQEGQNKQSEKAHKKHVSGEKPIELQRIQLAIAVNDDYERKLSIAFWNEATPGIDFGMDAETFEIFPTDAGWLQEDKSFVIDVRPFDISEEIPLFLKVEQASSKMTFSQRISEISDIRNLFILDTETNQYFSIKEEPLTLELNPGVYHGRFKLAFAEKIPQEKLPQVFFEEEAVPPKFDIFQNNYLGELEIIGNDSFPVKAVGIFDLQGKRMLYRTNFDNRRSISFKTAHWANAVYIVKVTGMDNQKTMKKISVYNK